MNNQRDIQKALESARDIFGAYKTEVSFGSVAGENAYRRAEKIAAVLYVLTSHMEATSVQKKSIMEGVESLLETVGLLGRGFRSSGHTSIEQVEQVSRVLSTRIKLLVLSNIISSQNADIVVGALGELLQYVRQSQPSLLADRVTLSRADVVPQEHTSSAPTPSIARHATSGQLLPARAAERTTGAIHSPRRELILSLLRKNGPLGIKDIAAHITDCGEKTVQRELQALVGLKLLKKEGEKRWSRYCVV